MSAHLLSILIALPLLAGAIVLFMPRQKPGAVRAFSVGAMLVQWVISFGVVLMADYSTPGMQLVTKLPLVPAYGISYEVGVDGISLWLVMLTTFMTPVALFASWTSIDTKVKEFALSFLFLETAMVGAFVSLDLFVFYVFWELMLVPMYLIIGIWGGVDRIYASVKFFLYTMVGSLLMFVAILYVVFTYKATAGTITFDITQLSALIVETKAQYLLFAAFALRSDAHHC
jgi:NADH-quinone oxidoreductase subunit M